MTRVHTITRAGRKERSASVRTNHRLKAKPTFKIVKEVIIQEKKKFRTVASYNAEPPDGYSFIPVGYPDLTELCKKKCQDQNLQFQTVNATPKNKANLDPDKVSHHIHRVGNHFPADIVRRSCQQLGYWINPAKPGEYKKYNVGLEDRLARHKHKDEKDKIRSAIQELFPNLPAKDLKEILQHAFRKGSMRVGNADMPLIRRVQLAVSAHARHNYTDYDKLLKTITWAEARQLAEQPTLTQLKKWRGEDFDNHETEEVLRETIVIDSESDDGSDTESSDDSSDTAVRNGNRDVSLEFVAHNTYGDRATDLARNGNAQYSAYIAPSRRQAEYQAFSQMHSRADPLAYSQVQHTHDRVQHPALMASAALNGERRAVDPHNYQEPHYGHTVAYTSYRAPAPAYTSSQSFTNHTPSHSQSFDRSGQHLAHVATAPSHHPYPRSTEINSNVAHTRPIYAYDRPDAIGNPYERTYERHRPSPPDLYTHNFPRLNRQATPDNAIPSIETQSPYRTYGPPLDSPQPRPRLVTDHEGRTIIVNVPTEQKTRHVESYGRPIEFSKRKSWTQDGYQAQPAVHSKRTRLSPRHDFQIPRPHGGYIDLTDDSPIKRGTQPSHVEYAAPRSIIPMEQPKPANARNYQPQPVPNYDLARTTRGPIQLDGAGERREIRYAPAYEDTRWEPEPAPARVVRGRPLNDFPAREPQQTAPVQQNTRREQRVPATQPQHPDDAMRSLYDEHDPQQTRKAHHKKHHASRPRYHDHDSSAVRQQDQPLDYL